MKVQWEYLDERTSRLELPNGYLYRYNGSGGSVAMCFVPVPNPSELYSHIKKQEQQS